MHVRTAPGAGRGRTGWIALFALTIAVLIGTGTVLPARAAAGTFQFEHADYFVTEGDSLSGIRVTRTGGTDNVNIIYGTDDDAAGATADRGVDYNNFSGFASFSENDTSDAIGAFVTIGNDEEDGERVAVLTLTPIDGSGATLGANATAKVHILDDDSGDAEFQWSDASFTFSEGDGDEGLEVVRFGPIDSAAEVSCRYVNVSGQDATPNEDFDLDTQELEFEADGARIVECDVDIIQDSDIEGPEVFGVELFDPSSGTSIGGTNPVVVTIEDDDSEGEFQFESLIYTVSEDDPDGEVVLTVERVGGATGDASIEFETDEGSADSPTDFQGRSGTLEFEDGEETQTIVIDIVDDSTVESPETFTVILSDPEGADLDTSRDVATVTITDDDGVGIFTFSMAEYSTAENGGSATITVLRGGTSSGTASVQYSTSAGSASAGTDYTQIPLTTLNFSNGQTSATFMVAIIDDTASETNETVNLTLSNPSAGYSLGTPQTALLTIIDNETQQPVVASVSPAQGPSTGGNLVTITGTNLLGATQVLFGSTSASISNVTSTQVLVIAPAGTGTVDVRVTTPVGTSVITTNDKYTYLPVPAVTSISPQGGPVAGGTAVTITGSNFTGATQVLFGNTAAASFTVVSNTQINAVSPAGVAGDVQVRVQNANGLSTTSLATRFTYGTAQAPTVTIGLAQGWTFTTWLGKNGITPTQALRGQENPDNPATIDIYNTVTVLWYWNGTRWLSFFPAGVSVPGANTLTSMPYGQAIWVYALGAINWVTVQGP